MYLLYIGDTNQSVEFYAVDENGDDVDDIGMEGEIFVERLRDGRLVETLDPMVIFSSNPATPYNSGTLVTLPQGRFRYDLPNGALIPDGLGEGNIDELRLIPNIPTVARIYHRPIIVRTVTEINQSRAYKLIEADMRLDKTVVPWQFVWYERGTVTELMRKDAVDMDGNNVISTTQKIGNLSE